MKSLTVSIFVFCVFVTVSVAQAQQTASPPQPTPLEAFATASSARITWSKQVGQIGEGQTQAIVTAIIIEDSARSPYRMRGVRIDLKNEKTADQVYLDESRLEPVRKALLEIESGIESFKKEGNAPNRYLGAELFWRPYERIHTLNAAHYIRPESSGLSLSAYRGEEFRFPRHRPIELADLISRAMRELNAQ